MTDTASLHVEPKLASLLGEGYRSSELALRELIDTAGDVAATQVHVTLSAQRTPDPIVMEDNGTRSRGVIDDA